MSKFGAWLLVTKNNAIDTLKTFLGKKEEGASAAEYALLLTIITVALVAVVGALGTKISTVIQDAINAL
jgi:Flp pilus assembly pilin Flp